MFVWFSRLYYKGNRVECPVCGGRFRKFLPYGYVNVRQGALCPGCLALERHRLLWLFLENKTSFFSSNLKVLHIAPEQCFLKRFRKLRNLTYHTADLLSPIADFKCDVQNLPFTNSEYDIVICNHVLEHVADDKKAISEIYRVIKPGGFAILQVPVDFSRATTFEDHTITNKAERSRIFGQYDHLRVYGRDYPDIIKGAGFTAEGQNYTESLTEKEKNRYGININEFMFAYNKPL